MPSSRVAAEVVRERAVRARVRLEALEDAVAAARVHRVLHDRPDVLLVADVLEDRRAQLVVDEQTARGHPRRLAAHVGRLLDRLADTGREPRVGHAGDLDGVPLDGHTVAAVRPDDLHVVADLLGGRVVLQPLHDLVGAALAGPARQHRDERRAARRVRVRVERDVGAVGERRVEQEIRSGALPLFTPKFMVACARWSGQPASRVSSTISRYASSARRRTSGGADSSSRRTRPRPGTAR